MIYDERHRALENMAVGMADIQLAHNPVASETIVIFNDLSVDHYQDSRIAEICRVKKLAVFNKVDDMNYVPDSDMGELQFDNDSIPFRVLMTITGLPRLPRRDDMLLNEGDLYTIHHVKPMNRDINGLLELIVYPERTTFVDPLHIHKHTFLDGVSLQPINDDLGSHIGEEVVLDMVYGGNPQQYSFDGENWRPFKSRVRFLYDGTQKMLHIRGGMEEAYTLL